MMLTVALSYRKRVYNVANLSILPLSKSNVGLVVEYDPATVETRVRFPDVAYVCLLGVVAQW